MSTNIKADLRRREIFPVQGVTQHLKWQIFTAVKPQVWFFVTLTFTCVNVLFKINYADYCLILDYFPPRKRMREKEIRIALTTSISYLLSFISYYTVCCPPPVCTHWLDVHYKDMETHFVTLFIIKPTRCTNFPYLLRHETLYVSGSSSAHHQEFIHCTLGTGICHTGFKTAFEQDQPVPLESCRQTCMTYVVRQ